MSQNTNRDPRYTDPTTRGQTSTIAAYGASARTPIQAGPSASLNSCTRPTAPSIATSWFTSSERQSQPQIQSQTTSHGRGRGRSRNRGLSQSQGRGRGRGQSSTREYSQSSTSQTRAAAVVTNISEDYSAGYGPAPPTGDDFMSTAQSPAPTFSSGYPPRIDFLDPRFVQDVRSDGDDDEGGGPGRFGYNQEVSSGPTHRLELQGDPVGAESQWTGPDGSDSNLLGKSSNNLNLGNEVIL